MKNFTRKKLLSVLMLLMLAPTAKLFAQPAVTLSPNTTQNISVGGTVSFTATRNGNSSNWPGGDGNFTYTWSSVPAGVSFSNNPNTVTNNSSASTATFPSGGTFQITCLVQEGGGGVNATSSATTVVVTVPTPALTLTPVTTAVLAGGTISFTAAASNFNGSGNITYTWTAPGTSIPGPNPNTAGGATDTKVITFPTAGTYNVSVNATRGTTNLTSTTIVINVYTAPATPNLWASSASGTAVSAITVIKGLYVNGPTSLFNLSFPGATNTTTRSAALGKSSSPTPATGYFYWLGTSNTNGGMVEVYASTSTGSTIARIGSLDMNGAGTNDLGFVRLGMGPDGRGWILAGDGTTLYLAKFQSNGTSAVTVSLEDADGVTLVGPAVAVANFQNGDLCVSGEGTIYALANNGTGITQLFSGTPNGNSTVMTKRFDLIDNATNAGFTGSVNGVAFDAFGSIYFSTDQGIFYLDAATVNGPAGTVGLFQVLAVTGIQDLASNLFPTGSPLPLRMTAFSVGKQGTNALLKWTTANESNTHHFEIQKSIDGVNFETIANKTAAGNSSMDIDYQYNDPIANASGIIYYRIKTLDVDGKYYYSNIVALRLNDAVVKDFSVYPNPFRNNFKMEISSDKVKDVNIRISNAVGQKSLERTVSLTKGVNTIVLSSEIANLPAGMYLIDIISDQEKQTRKIFKQ